MYTMITLYKNICVCLQGLERSWGALEPSLLRLYILTPIIPSNTLDEYHFHFIEKKTVEWHAQGYIAGQFLGGNVRLASPSLGGFWLTKSLIGHSFGCYNRYTSNNGLNQCISLSHQFCAALVRISGSSFRIFLPTPVLSSLKWNALVGHHFCLPAGRVGSCGGRQK